MSATSQVNTQIVECECGKIDMLHSGIGLLLTLMALFILTQYGTSGVLNPDFYLHILNGEWMLGHLALPERDVFSWTSPEAAYMLPQWGSEIVMTVSWLLGGAWGTKIMTAAVACTMLYVMYRVALIQFKSPLGAFAATVLLAGGTLLSLQAQPAVFSYLIFSLVVLVSEIWRERGGRKILYWLVPLFILWANMDYWYVLGFAYLGIITIGMGVGFAIKSGKADDFWRVTPFAIATLVAGFLTIINPYGIAAWDNAYVSIGAALVARDVFSDWASPALASRGGLQIMIVILMLTAAAGFSRRRLRAEEFMAFALFLTVGMASRASVPFFMIAMVPILSRLSTTTQLLDWIRDQMDGECSVKPQLIVLALSVPVMFMLAVVVKQSGEQTFRDTNAVGALDFMVKNNLTERVMHGIDESGYFAYSTGMKLFIDRRAQLYGSSFYTEYLNAINGRPGYIEFINKWNPQAVLVPTEAPLRSLLITSNGPYRLVYESSGSSIFVR